MKKSLIFVIFALIIALTTAAVAFEKSYYQAVNVSVDARGFLSIWYERGGVSGAVPFEFFLPDSQITELFSDSETGAVFSVGPKEGTGFQGTFHASPGIYKKLEMSNGVVIYLPIDRLPYLKRPQLPEKNEVTGPKGFDD